jgi:hypothetical protein
MVDARGDSAARKKYRKFVEAVCNVFGVENENH